MSSAKEVIPQAGSNGDSPQALKSWWTTFKKGKRKAVPAVEAKPPQGIFGVPLKDSIQYANVAISLMDDQGKSFIYGYVPIVVAKCGVFLKEKATDVEGIFRLSGSAKRIKELQGQFDAPPRYGKGLDWTGYTVHDAANVFRRYLNQLPQPIVPLEFYEKFREPLRGHQSQAVGNSEEHIEAATATEDFDHDKAIATYQELITQIPPLNRQLLLYILDLLSVFAFKADVNRMTSANLAAIFQPGMLSHPDHDMSPSEYRLSQDVIIFLIDNQDSFLIGMSGTAADEKTVREVQAGPPMTPSRSTGTGLGRSVSNASGGADSARKLGGVRRNISVSSKNSKHSSAAHTPVTPQSGGFSNSTGVHRSNTVPSKRSPGLSSTRAGRGIESPTASVALSPAVAPPPSTQPTNTVSKQPSTPTVTEPTSSAALGEGKPGDPNQESARAKSVGSPPQNENNLTIDTTPPKNKNRPSLLKQMPSSDGKDGRQPNKLKKKRDPARSANSSTNSLSNAEYIESLPIPKDSSLPIAGTAPRVGDGLEESMGPSTLQASQQPSESTLKPKSPAGSVHSKSDVTDQSEHEHVNGSKIEKAEKKRWRFSSAPKKDKENDKAASAEGPNMAAGKSTGSLGNDPKAHTSSNDVSGAALETVPSEQAQTESSGASKDKDADEPEQKRGLFGRLRARVEKSREEHRAKEAEKDRGKSKSPSRDQDRSGSKHSLSQMAHDIMPHLSRNSGDVPKDRIGGHDGTADGADKPTEKAATSPVAVAGEQPAEHIEAKPTESATEASTQKQAPCQTITEEQKLETVTDPKPLVLEATDSGNLHPHTEPSATELPKGSKDVSAPPANALIESSAEGPARAPAQASTGPSASRD